MAVFFRNKRIAAYIRTGFETDAAESVKYWIGHGDKCYACAVGMAMIGKMGIFRANVAFIEKLRENHGDEIKTVSELLEISPALASEISRLHQMDVSALEIAEVLEFESGNDQFDECVLDS